jgi:ABC-type phosphate transport system substrate-binding protein
MKCFLWALCLPLLASAGSAHGEDFKLVVHRSNPLSSITATEVSQLFLKKKTTWPGGERAAPVDQPENSPIRQSFSRKVLKKDVAAVRGYWNSQIFSGRAVPASEAPSDALVLEFVEATPGAIGYVSRAAPVGRGVKEIQIH